MIGVNLDSLRTQLDSFNCSVITSSENHVIVRYSANDHVLKATEVMSRLGFELITDDRSAKLLDFQASHPILTGKVSSRPSLRLLFAITIFFTGMTLALLEARYHIVADWFRTSGN